MQLNYSHLENTEHRTPRPLQVMLLQLVSKIITQLALSLLLIFVSMSRTPRLGNCFEDGTPAVCLSERVHTLDQLQAERHAPWELGIVDAHVM